MEQRNKQECSAGMSRAVFPLLTETQGEEDMKSIFPHAGMAWPLLGAALGEEKALNSVYNAITWFLYFGTPGLREHSQTPQSCRNNLGMTSLGCVPIPVFPGRIIPPPQGTADPQGLSLLSQNRFFPWCERG